MNQFQKNKKLKKEKLFPAAVPRSTVKLRLVNELRATITVLQRQKAAKIIDYKSVTSENGEYYLISNSGSSLKPLANYLKNKEMNCQKLLLEFKQIFESLKVIKTIKELFPSGINAANFWIDSQENIYLMPESILEIKKNYSDLNFEIPSSEYFRSPEIISNQNWQLESYIFNLASDLYYFLTKECIFTDQDKAKILTKIQHQKILEVKVLNSQISSELNNLIMQMLAKDKNQRSKLDFILKKLDKIAKQNTFLLNPFQLENNLDSQKTVKNKRRIEKIQLFFRQSWKVLLFFVIIIGGFIWGLGSGPRATIDQQTSPAEVVNYFYQAVANKNITLVQETVDFDLDQMEKLISESHVIEKIQSAYSNQTADQKIKKVYQLKDLKIKKLSAAKKKYKFKANYSFSYQDQTGTYSSQVEDQLLLEKVKGSWKITKIKGDFKAMISGNYPWRENDG